MFPWRCGFDECRSHNPGRPSDAAGMKRCAERAYQHYIPRMGKPPAPMLEDYEDIIQRHTAFVIEEQGEIIGLLVLIPKASAMLLDNIAVDPAHRGKGPGRRLLEPAETRARSRGYAHLELYTNRRMTENLAMYPALEYAETGRRLEQGYNRIYMRKAL